VYSEDSKRIFLRYGIELDWVVSRRLVFTAC